MDREKVIKGIRKCLSHKPCSENGCPYENECAVEHLNDPLLRDAITLLKEQAPKKGHWEMKADPFGFFDEIPVCSECGCTNAMRKKTEFCEHCGADMKEGDGDG